MSKFSSLVFLIMFSLSCFSTEYQKVTYNKSHIKIVESGFKSFKLAFQNASDSEKNSLLFCLERFVDPYYSNSITYEKELYDWLVKMLNSKESVAVKENSLDLLTWDSNRRAIECEILKDGKLLCPKGAIWNITRN